MVITLLTVPKIFAQGKATDGPTPSGLATGSAAGSYSLSGFENVNLYNGNLNFNLPLLKIGGRGGAQSSVQLTIDSEHWVVKKDPGSRSNDCEPETYDPFNVGIHPPIVGNNCTGTIIPPSWSVEADLHADEIRVGYGPGVLQGKVAVSSGKALLHLRFNTPDGGEVELRDLLRNGQPDTTNGANPNRGTIFLSADGSAVTFISNTALSDNMAYPGMPIRPSGYLHFKDGTRYEIINGLVMRICDRNGNEIHYAYYTDGWGNNPRVHTITDSLGRTVSFDYASDTIAYDKISFNGVGGAARVIKIWRGLILRQTQSTDESSPKTYGELFSTIYNHTSYQPSGTNKNDLYSPTGSISKVELPDGRYFRLFYNVYGEVARIELPTGGAIEYDYTPGTGTNSTGNGFQVHRRVIKRRLYADGTNLTNAQSYTPTYSQSYDNNGIFQGWMTDLMFEQRDAAGNLLEKTNHNFWGSPVNSVFKLTATYSSWLDGKEKQTTAYDTSGSATTVLRQTTNAWQQCADCDLSIAWWQPANYEKPSDAPANNPRLVETATTLLDGGANLTGRQTFAYDKYNNLTDTYEYDYGANGALGQFLRRSHTDYVTDANYTTYTGAHLRGLMLQTWISSDINGSNKASLAQFEYDNYTTDSSHAGLINRTSVTGFDATNYGSDYTKRGNPTAVTSFATVSGQTIADPVTVYTQYNVLGNVVKVVDAKGYVSTIDYTDRFGAANGEARGNWDTTSAPTQLNGLSTFAFPTSATNALGWVTGYSQFDYYTGAAVDSEDLNGNVSSVFYNDALDRPTQTISANNRPTQRSQTTIVYDDSPAARKTTVTSDLFEFGDNLTKSESLYDGLGRTVETHRYESNGTFITTKTVPFLMVQDPETFILRQATKSSNPYRQNETPVWTTSLSDSLGRGIKVITSDGAFVKTEYIGNSVTVTDQAGKQRRSITNAIGQLKRVDEPNEAGSLGTIGSPAQPTYYEYNPLNNLTQVQQNGTGSAQCGATNATCTQTRSFIYDSLSRLKTAINPESGTISYQYDNNGNLTKKTDARLVETTYIYDELNRVKNRSYSVTGTVPANYEATPPVTYTYDGMGATPAIAFAKGKLTEVDNGVSKTKYTAFDEVGRVTASEQVTPGATIGAQTYSYNLSGALIEEKYPSGRVVKNNLDDNGNLETVQSKKNQTAGYWNYAKNFNYTAAGAVNSMQLGNGRWQSIVFNSRLQATQIALGTIQNGTDKLKLDYDYGTTQNNGDVLSQQITVPTVGSNQGFTATQNYVYDSLNRIKQAAETISSQTSWQQKFTYDRYGNRTFDEANTTATFSFQKNCVDENNNAVVCGNDRLITNPSINPTNNRLNGYNSDSAGNITKDAQSRKFTFDGENKQTKVETVNGSGNPINIIGQYFYDGDGKRVKKYVPSTGEITVFVYNASGKMIAEYSDVVLSQSEAKVNYLTTDHLGSQRINTDQNGEVISRHDYQPFGEEIQRANYGNDSVKQKFTGYEKDAETNLDFAQARYFNSGLGRFSTPDYFANDTHVIDPQSWNLYAYVRNNPLKYVDITGKELVFVTINYVGQDYRVVKNSDNTYKFVNTDTGKDYDRSNKIVNALVDAVNRQDTTILDRLINADSTDLYPPEQDIYYRINSDNSSEIVVSRVIASTINENLVGQVDVTINIPEGNTPTEDNVRDAINAIYTTLGTQINSQQIETPVSSDGTPENGKKKNLDDYTKEHLVDERDRNTILRGGTGPGIGGTLPAAPPTPAIPPPPGPPPGSPPQQRR